MGGNLPVARGLWERTVRLRHGLCAHRRPLIDAHMFHDPVLAGKVLRDARCLPSVIATVRRGT